MRMYNPALCKFYSVDPMFRGYAELSSYQFASNSPINSIDMDGLETWPDDLLRRGINAGKAKLINYAEEAIKNLVIAAAKATMQAGVDKVDKAASNELIEYSIEVDPKVGNYSESEKEQVFTKDAEKTKAIIIYEFATGEGEPKRDFNWDHPITKEIASGYVVSDIQSAVANKAKNMTYDEFKSNPEGFSKGIQFSPSGNPLSWPKSAYRHIASNGSQFFMGGAIAKITPSTKEGWVNVTITNLTSRNSLLFHVAENYNSSSGKRLATRIQTYTFAVKIDITDFKEKEDNDDKTKE